MILQIFIYITKQITMEKTAKILNILINTKPIFSNKEEEDIWLKNIADFCEISGIFKNIDQSKKNSILEINKYENKV